MTATDEMHLRPTSLMQAAFLALSSTCFSPKYLYKCTRLPGVFKVKKLALVNANQWFAGIACLAEVSSQRLNRERSDAADGPGDGSPPRSRTCLKAGLSFDMVLRDKKGSVIFRERNGRG